MMIRRVAVGAAIVLVAALMSAVTQLRVSDIEDDNPVGIHVRFNFVPDLRPEILGLEVRDQARPHLPLQVW